MAAPAYGVSGLAESPINVKRPSWGLDRRELKYNTKVSHCLTSPVKSTCASQPSPRQQRRINQHSTSQIQSVYGCSSRLDAQPCSIFMATLESVQKKGRKK